METVSGVAGLIKVVLMMQYDEIPPQANFETLNPHIRLDGTRVTIPIKHIAWPREGARTAGVSSFGFGGTNTHLIVESPSTSVATSKGAPPATDRPLHLLKLSAKSEAALSRQAEQLAAALEGQPSDGPLDRHEPDRPSERRPYQGR